MQPREGARTPAPRGGEPAAQGAQALGRERLKLPAAKEVREDVEVTCAVGGASATKAAVLSGSCAERILLI